ncbi:MAG: hypothetical protein QOD65_2890 [Gaiellales bacterium]|jgi:hypothetical protein|nr:hypothetical protein [Gaiellales bacterium]
MRRITAADQVRMTLSEITEITVSEQIEKGLAIPSEMSERYELLSSVLRRWGMYDSNSVMWIDARNALTLHESEQALERKRSEKPWRDERKRLRKERDRLQRALAQYNRDLARYELGIPR